MDGTVYCTYARKAQEWGEACIHARTTSCKQNGAGSQNNVCVR